MIIEISLFWGIFLFISIFFGALVLFKISEKFLDWLSEFFKD
jgi:hypothetical protein